MKNLLNKTHTKWLIIFGVLKKVAFVIWVFYLKD